MNIRKLWIGFFAGVSMLVIILDTQTALSGAKEGISFCAQVVVPSLFPMFVLTILLSNILCCSQSYVLSKTGMLCKMPKGSESLLLIGLISGYPVGAQCVTEAYENHRLDRESARRLLGFCSNAGPSFIFGMVSMLFYSRYTAFLLWGIHITAAVITGILMPATEYDSSEPTNYKEINMAAAVEKSVKSMAMVCAWVILFRVILAFLQRWLLHSLPEGWSSVIAGTLELANGIHWLRHLCCQGLRFVLSSAFLSFGGLCVLLQTISITGELGLGNYFPGKLLQTAISFLLSYLLQFVIFAGDELWNLGWTVALLPVCIMIVLVWRMRKNSSNLRSNVV